MKKTMTTKKKKESLVMSLKTKVKEVPHHPLSLEPLMLSWMFLGITLSRRPLSDRKTQAACCLGGKGGHPIRTARLANVQRLPSAAPCQPSEADRQIASTLPPTKCATESSTAIQSPTQGGEAKLGILLLLPLLRPKLPGP